MKGGQKVETDILSKMRKTFAAVLGEGEGMSNVILPSPRRALTGNLYCILSMVVWAAGFPAAEALLQSWEPLPLVAMRFCTALAVLIPVWLVMDGYDAVRRARWGWGLLSGAIGFGGGAWLMLLAQSFTDPVTVAIIAASSPIAASLIEWAAERKPLKATFLIGLLASVIGGVVATGGGAPASGAGTNLGLGVLCAVASCTLFAWASYIAVRDFVGLSAIGRTTIPLAGGLMFTTICCGIAWSVGWASAPVSGWTAGTIGLLAIYGIGGMAISQFFWIASVERLGIGLAAFHINVAPFYVMLFLVLLGAGWSWPQAIGAAIVALGVVIAQR
jgi:drug/metabolite transporter (DMT)-like permease